MRERSKSAEKERREIREVIVKMVGEDGLTKFCLSDGCTIDLISKDELEGLKREAPGTLLMSIDSTVVMAGEADDEMYVVPYGLLDTVQCSGRIDILDAQHCQSHCPTKLANKHFGRQYKIRK